MWQWNISVTTEYRQGIQLILVGVLEGVGVCGSHMIIWDGGGPHRGCGKTDPRCLKPLGAEWWAQAPVQRDKWKVGLQTELCVLRFVWIHTLLVGLRYEWTLGMLSCRWATGVKGGAKEDKEGILHHWDHSEPSNTVEKFLSVLCVFPVSTSTCQDCMCLPVCTDLEQFFQGSDINPKLYPWGLYASCWKHHFSVQKTLK